MSSIEPLDPSAVTSATATSGVTTTAGTTNDIPLKLYSACNSDPNVATFIYYSKVQKRNKTKTGWITRMIGVTTKGDIWQLEDTACDALREAETTRPCSTTTTVAQTVPGQLVIKDPTLAVAGKLPDSAQIGIQASLPVTSQPHLPGQGNSTLTLLRIPVSALSSSRLLLALFSATPRRRVIVKMIDTFMTTEFKILADHRLLKLRTDTMECKAKWLEALQTCIYIQNVVRTNGGFGASLQVSNAVPGQESSMASSTTGVSTAMTAAHGGDSRATGQLDHKPVVPARPTPRSQKGMRGATPRSLNRKPGGRALPPGRTTLPTSGELSFVSPSASLSFSGTSPSSQDGYPSRNTRAKSGTKALTPEAHIGIRGVSATAATNEPYVNRDSKAVSQLVLPVVRQYKAPISRAKRGWQFMGVFASGLIVTALLSILSVVLIASTELSMSGNSLQVVSAHAVASVFSQDKTASSPTPTLSTSKALMCVPKKRMPMERLYSIKLVPWRPHIVWQNIDTSALNCHSPADLAMHMTQGEQCSSSDMIYMSPVRESSFMKAYWSAKQITPALHLRVKSKPRGWHLANQLMYKYQETRTLNHIRQTPSQTFKYAFGKEHRALSQSLMIVRAMAWFTMLITCCAVLCRALISLRKTDPEDDTQLLERKGLKRDISIGTLALVLALIVIIASNLLKLSPFASILLSNTIISVVCARVYCTTKLWAFPEDQKPQSEREHSAGAVDASSSATQMGAKTNSGLRLSVASTASSGSVINPQTPTATMYPGTPDGGSSIISQPNLTTSQHHYARHFGVLRPTEPRASEDTQGEEPTTAGCTESSSASGKPTEAVEAKLPPLPYPRYVVTKRGEMFIAKLMEKFQRLLECADVTCRPHEWKKEGTYEGILVESHCNGPKNANGNSALMCRGMGTVRIPPAKFMSLLWLTQHKNKYDEMCERVTTLEVVNNHVKIEEQEYKGYGVVSSRRMVLLAGWQRVDFGSHKYPKMELSDDVKLPPQDGPHTWRYGQEMVLHGLIDRNVPIEKGDPAKEKNGGRPRNLSEADPDVPKNANGYEYSADGYAMLAISLPDAIYDRPKTAPPIDPSLVEANLELGGFVIRGVKLPKLEKKGGGLWGGGQPKPDTAAQSVPEEQDFVWGCEVWGLGSIDLGGKIPNWIASQISRRQPLLVGRGEKYMMTTVEPGQKEVLFHTIDVGYMYA